MTAEYTTALIDALEAVLRTSRSDADKVAAVAEIVAKGRRMIELASRIEDINTETRAIEARVLVSEAGY